MSPPAFTTRIPMGTVAALLTTLEYILSTISALSIRAALHGFWLVQLHRDGNAVINSRERLRRSFRKDLASAILCLWLVIGVALVESNLQSGIQISPSTTNSTECVSMYGKYRSHRIFSNPPSIRTTIEPWILRIALKLNCGSGRGIATVGVGGTTNAFGVKEDMSSPTCDNALVNIAAGEVVMNISELKFASFYFMADPNFSGTLTLFPHDKTNLGRGRGHLGIEGGRICAEKGISNYFFNMGMKLETPYMYGSNMSFGIHERLCTLHSTPITVVSDSVVTSCKSERSASVNITCVHKTIPPALIHEAALSNVSALFVSQGTGNMSYACPWASVRLEYIFVNPSALDSSRGRMVATLPIMLVVSARVTSGYCERTVAVLGQAALLYSNDAVWRGDQLGSLSHLQRYYAYLMAVSSSQQPLNIVTGKEDPRGPNDECFIHEVFGVTEVPMDWRWYILLIGLISAVLVMLAGAAFRALYSAENWAVGSANWSLRRMAADGMGEIETVVEVVPVKQEKTDKIKQKISDNFSPAQGATKGKKSVEYEYRVRKTRNEEDDV